MKIYNWLTQYLGSARGRRYQSVTRSRDSIHPRSYAVKQNRRRAARAIRAFALLALLGGSAAEATADEPCDVRLTVEFTPDVPDASDDRFLSSLLNDHPDYRLELVREDDASVLELALTGPGPENRCQSVIQTMRKDAHVLSIQVDSVNVAIELATGSFSGSESSEEHVSERGLNSLDWAFHHPRQAWRILLPIQSSDAAAGEMPQG